MRVVLAAPAALLALGLFACGPESERSTPEPSPAAPPAAVYVDEAGCAGCHPAEHAAWTGSDHDLAMQAASETSVLGDFDDAVFEGAGIRARFFRRGGRFFVHTAGRDGKPADFEVRDTFGVRPLQQLLLPFPGGRLQAFSVAWDTRPKSAGGQRWFALEPEHPPAPGDAYHWTGSEYTWNHQCAECHSTDLRKRFDPVSRTYDTRFAREDVGCQACHGPGSTHVSRAEAGSLDAGSGLVDLSNQVEACAPCHARRHRVSAEDEPGRPLLDDFVPETLREGLYYPDGQILAEDYVYGSFLQSRMYAAGVRCSDCHDPHTTRVRAQGNALCVRCHSPSPDVTAARFPSLQAKRYDSPEHHHHAEGSPGARCVACHMPSRVYMQIDARRDHSLRVPRPDLTEKIGTPNACQSCHAERGAAWAARAVAGWFPASTHRGAHYGEVFAAARRGDASAAAPLAALVSDRSKPAIVRATAVELAPRFGAPGFDAVATGCSDRDGLVRTYAAGALQELPAADRLVLGVPLLSDPLRSVRVAAAVSLSSLSEESVPQQARAALRAALGEYVASQRAQLDTPEGNLNLAVLAEHRGDDARAESLYRAALALDAAFYPAQANLAKLQARLGRLDDAEATLRDGIAHSPEAGALYDSLGLLLAQRGRLEEAVRTLGRARELLPRHARTAYNQGLALQQLGRPAEAERALRDARALDPADPDIAYALAVLYVQQGDYAKALAPAQDAVRLRGDEAARHLLDTIRERS